MSQCAACWPVAAKPRERGWKMIFYSAFRSKLLTLLLESAVEIDWARYMDSLVIELDNRLKLRLDELAARSRKPQS